MIGSTLPPVFSLKLAHTSRMTSSQQTFPLFIALFEDQSLALPTKWIHPLSDIQELCHGNRIGTITYEIRGLLPTKLGNPASKAKLNLVLS